MAERYVLYDGLYLNVTSAAMADVATIALDANKATRADTADVATRANKWGYSSKAHSTGAPSDAIMEDTDIWFQYIG